MPTACRPEKSEPAWRPRGKRRRQTRPPGAHAQGVSHASVARIWDAHRLHLHRIETFKLSKDTRCVETLTDVVSVDEKPQVHALDRTHPGVPMKNGRCGPLTHDYKPHRTTGLFAARTALDGTVSGTCYPRHRHEEWLTFLHVIDRDTSPGQARHLILDNDGTHHHPHVKKWMARPPRLHLHGTPTSAS